MTDHLPECPSGQRRWQRAEAPMYGALCICRELRAAEQRVLAAKGATAIAYERGLEVGYWRGINAAHAATGYSPDATDNRP